MEGMLPPNPVLVTRNYKKSQLRDMKGYLKGYLGLQGREYEDISYELVGS